jgi:hypothetical protein
LKNVRIEIRIHNGHVYNDDVLKIKHIFTSTPQEMWTGAAKSIKHTSAEKNKQPPLRLKMRITQQKRHMQRKELRRKHPVKVTRS